jgi:acetyl esterase/lipase
MRQSRALGIGVLALLALLALLGTEPVTRRLRAARLLLALGNVPAAQARGSLASVAETELTLDLPGGPVRARLYRPQPSSPGPGLLVAHGVHYRGIDERRLMPFARELARAGRVVLTPELRDLADYRITAQGIQVIAESARWLSEQRTLVDSPKVGLLGFSFAGGLSLLAAQRRELDQRLEFVSSIGGHHDLERVLTFLVSEQIETPLGVQRATAHEYGLVVLLYQHLEEFVDEEDRVILAEALKLWLREDRARSWAVASRRTTESGERLFQLLSSGRLRELAPRLTELIGRERAALRVLSPRGRLRALPFPVYLLHGLADSVIPPSETAWAARELAGNWNRALVSPLLGHVEVSHAPRLRDGLALVEFMSDLL